MRKVSTTFAVLLTVLMAFMLFFAGCGSSSDTGTEPAPTQSTLPTGSGSIIGKVTDEAGSPLSGASVTVTVQGDEPTDGSAYPYDTKEGFVTDDTGTFMVENLATGVTYLVVIEYSGRVTLKPVVALTDGEPQAVFEITLPIGDGEATFNLPAPPTLNEAIITHGYYGNYYYNDGQQDQPQPKATATPVTDEGPIDAGAEVTLTWTRSEDKGIAFDGFYMVRSTTSPVDTSGDLVFESTSSIAKTCTDALPYNGFGYYYYRLFQSFAISEVNARVLLGSNEVKVYWDKYKLSQVWDTEGVLMNPMGIAVYETTTGVQAVYVTDYDDVNEVGRVQKLDANGNLLATWPKDTDEYYFDFPGGIAVDSNGNVYVGDNGMLFEKQPEIPLSNRIMKLDSNGDFITEWSVEGAAGIAVGPGIAPTPEPTITSTASDITDGKATLTEVLYAAHPGYYEIWKYDLNGENAEFFGHNWDPPYGVAVGPDGRVVTSIAYFWSDQGNYYYMVSDYDGSYIYDDYYWYYYYPNSEAMGLPSGVAVDGAGDIFLTIPSAIPETVTERSKFTSMGYDGFVKYMPSGSTYYVPETYFGEQGSEDGQFEGATGIAVDSQEKVYVVDSRNKRIQVMELDK